uniref:B-cell receptor CD22-like n=1 Tax=Xiphophorus maculatus TaxID=8083 RepID=M3ZU25_XIPMA
LSVRKRALKTLFAINKVQSKWNVNCNSQNICALKGSTVRMHCDYSHPYRQDGTTISVKQTFWFTKTDKDPLDLNTQEEYAGRVENSCISEDCTLTIRDVKESDSAAYKFRFVTNKSGGSYTGPKVVLSVRDSNPNLTVKKKNYYNLECSSSCVLPDDSTYVWYKNGQNIHIGKYFSKTWASNTDSISCALKGHEDFPSPSFCEFIPTSFSNTTSFPVTVSAEMSDFSFIFMLNLISTSVSADFTDDIVEGNQVFLKCSSNANPPANYTWYKKTQSSTVQLHGKDSEVYLHEIQTSDSGKYFCVANNQLGESISEYLNIDVKYAPKRADVSLSHVEIVEGDSVHLTCSSDGNPTPSYSWYKDNQEMLQGQGGMYQFTSVTSEDSGTYCCEVGNIYGRMNSSSVLINVECKYTISSEGLIIALFIYCMISNFKLPLLGFKNKTELISLAAWLCDYLRYSVNVFFFLFLFPYFRFCFICCCWVNHDSTPDWFIFVCLHHF